MNYQFTEQMRFKIEGREKPIIFLCQKEGIMRKIIKRDGRKEVFDERKIFVAIDKAFSAADIDDDAKVESVVDDVLAKIDVIYKDNKLPKVEDIQDLIEDTLIEHGESAVAKRFILYRAERTRIREANTSLMHTLHDLTFKDASENDNKRENANIDGDTAMGTMLKYGSESAKEFYVSQVIGKPFADAHKNGDIHIHDMDFYTLTMTCCQIDLTKLFEDGFSTGHGFLREPNSIRAYASLAAIAIQANQNDQHGGQSIPNFDYAMAPGVKKSYRKALVSNVLKMYGIFDEELTKDDAKSIIKAAEEQSSCQASLASIAFNNKLLEVLKKRFPDAPNEKLHAHVLMVSKQEVADETYQAMEALVHNLNTMHSRAGAQVPFSSLNYGTDTSPEGRLVMDKMLDATLAGLGNGETPIFPIQIFKVKEGINYNPDDPNYDLFKKAIVVSGHRLFPNFSFLDSPFNLQYYKPNDWRTEATYMGCRTRVVSNVDKDKEVVNGRGNLSFTSINLPRIAIEHPNEKDFFARLDELMALVRDQLLERYEIQCRKRVYNFPFLMGEHVWLDSDTLGPNDEVRNVLRHGTLTIGFIGLAEALVALTGHHHGEDPKSQELGLRIIKHMRTLCDNYTKDYQLNFSLIGTPAEGLSGRFVRLDKQKYGVIKGVTDQDFYTNSFHVPVYYPIKIKDKIQIEAPYHALTNGGHITYVEVDGDVAKNPEAFETIIRCMHDSGIGYGAVNHPVDRDPVCGYNGIIDNVCPRCGRTEDGIKFERIRRITGYLVGTVDRFNNGKRAELEHRVKHMTKADLTPACSCTDEK